MKIEEYLTKAIKITLVTLIILLPLYFDKSLVGIYDISKATVLWIGGVFILGCWLSLLSLGKGFPPKTILTLSLFAWAIVNILATISSESPLISIFGFYKRYNGLLTHLSYTVIALSLIRFGDKEFLKKIIKIVIVIGVISAIYGIMQYFGTDYFFPERQGGGRVSSFMGNPIFSSCYLIMTLFLALGFYFYSEGLWIWIYGFAFSVIYISFFMMQTRGTFMGFGVAYLVFVISFLLFFLYRRKDVKKKVKRFYIGLIIIALITISSNLSSESTLGRFAKEFLLSKSKVKNEEIETNLPEKKIEVKGSAKVRLCIWKDIAMNLSKKPLLGTGPDTMAISYPKYRSLETVKTVGAYVTAESSHNEFLDIVAQKGILGALSYLWILIAFLYLSIKTISFEKGEGWWTTGIIFSWLSYIFQAQTAFGVHSTESLFWILTGGMGILYKKQIKREKLKRLTSNQKMLLAGILLITLISLILIITPYRADMAYRKAFDLKDKRPFSEVISAYEKVIKIWPYDVQYLQELNSLYLTASQQEGNTKKWLLAARDIAQKLLVVNPNSDIAYTVIATSYYLEDREKNINRVIENFKKAAEKNPYSVDVHYNFAQMYQREGQNSEAISEYERCLLADPICDRALKMLLPLYISFERQDEAKKALQVALELEPNNSELLSKLQSLEIQKF
ncbi:MAG: O-antigen ligase family protein [bacterium]|nr:O-antigen ligase family protein [bacterium]